MTASGGGSLGGAEWPKAGLCGGFGTGVGGG